MRNNHWSQWMAMLAAILAQQAHAAAETPAQELTRIEAETAVLKARARKVEVQAQIASKHAEIATRNAEVRRAQQPASSELPVLVGIEGVGSAMQATLETPQGSTVEVRQGDRLPDGSRVASIGSREVVLETAGKRQVRLARTTTATAPQASADAAAMPPMGYPGGMRR